MEEVKATRRIIQTNLCLLSWIMPSTSLILILLSSISQIHQISWALINISKIIFMEDSGFQAIMGMPVFQIINLLVLKAILHLDKGILIKWWVNIIFLIISKIFNKMESVGIVLVVMTKDKGIIRVLEW